MSKRNCDSDPHLPITSTYNLPTTFTYNAANQITNAGYSYDNAGNLAADGTTTYTYDALSRTTVRGGTTYAYNGDGTLVSQLTGGVTTLYTQDLAAPLTQVLQTKVGSAARTDYLYGLNRLASLNSGVKTWYAYDALGSVRRTVADAGTPLGVVNYDPWGTPETGTVSTFGFTGELQDVDRRSCIVHRQSVLHLMEDRYSTAYAEISTRFRRRSTLAIDDGAMIESCQMTRENTGSESTKSHEVTRKVGVISCRKVLPLEHG